MSLDWDRIERWQPLLEQGEVSELRDLFGAAGARGPGVKWRPEPADLSQRQAKFALAHWLGAASDGVPSLRIVDPVALAPALGYLMIVEVVDGARDVIYRLIGTNLIAVSGFDMTRKRLSEHPMSSYIRDYSMALYRAVIARREPVWSHYGPAAAVATAAWERVILPLADDAGAIVRFLVAAVPIGLNGEALRA